MFLFLHVRFIIFERITKLSCTTNTVCLSFLRHTFSPQPKVPARFIYYKSSSISLFTMLSQEENNHRRAEFKKTVDEHDNRRRRQETRIQLRKNKKEESLMKRRFGYDKAQTNNDATTMDNNGANNNNVSKKVPKPEDIPELMRMLTNTNHSTEELIEQRIQAVRSFRRMLSVERDPPVGEVVQAGVIPYFVQCLNCSESWTLIFEAAWALTNIASTNMTSSVVDAPGAIESLIQLLKHDMADVREQAAWCLGNVAGDSRIFRDGLLESGILEPLLLNMELPANMSLLNNVTWAVSNLCRGKPAPDIGLVQPAIRPLAELLHKPVSVDVLIDAVWALSYLSDGNNERIEEVMSTGVTTKLVEFLEDKESPLLTPTVRCLGNFVTGSDEQTQVVLEAGVLNHMKALLCSPRKCIRKESCWLISNISAGTTEQIAMLFAKGGIVKKVTTNAMDAPWDIRKEAIWALSNICTTGTDLQVQGVIQCDGVEALCNVLKAASSEAKIILAALDAIERVLEIGSRLDKDYGFLIDEYDGIDMIENLQEHPNDDVYKKAVKILETYFAEEEADDENLAPTTTADNTFAFGVTSKQLFPPNAEGGSSQGDVLFNFGGPSQQAAPIVFGNNTCTTNNICLSEI